MKCIWKLASRVLETRVPYKSRVSKTCFLLANLDRFLSHRSQVFYTRFQNTQNKKLLTQKKKKTQKKERRKKETQKSILVTMKENLMEAWWLKLRLVAKKGVCGLPVEAD